MAKLALKSISITRAEGPYEGCYWPAGETRMFMSWRDATVGLARLCYSLDPKMLGYDKCDFTCTFEDGETYQGRFDAAHPKSSSHKRPDLAARIRDYLSLMAGQRRAAWMVDANWHEHLRRIEDVLNGHAKSIKDEAAEFLAKYDIPTNSYVESTPGGEL